MKLLISKLFKANEGQLAQDWVVKQIASYAAHVAQDSEQGYEGIYFNIAKDGFTTSGGDEFVGTWFWVSNAEDAPIEAKISCKDQ